MKKIKKWIKDRTSPMRWIGKEIKYNVNSFLNFYNWWKVKRRALRAHKYTGLQHHVIPSGPTTLTIVNNRWLKWYNKNTTGKKIDIKTLLESAYFSTPIGNRVLTKK